MWQHLTGARIVDLRAIKKTVDAYWYITKYLAKLKSITWSTRRCSWSRGFWLDETFKGGTSLHLICPTVETAHPLDWLLWNHSGATIERITSDAFVFSGGRASV